VRVLHEARTLRGFFVKALKKDIEVEYLLV
jgi:hypothetical protein